jgi:hypothetical protein
MKRKIIIKTAFWLILSIFFGFMPLWTKLMNSSIDASKIFSLKSMMIDCSILYFCCAATISVCADYFFNTTTKFIFLKELLNVIILPLFIFFWTIIVVVNVLSLPENTINITTVLVNTIVVAVFTIVYIILMKSNEFSKLNSL